MILPRMLYGDDMTTEDFLHQAELLTGTEIKGETEIDKPALAAILADDSRQIDCSQFNELLLLIHKDRVEGCFFDFFFGPDCAIRDIPKGVQKFQKIAMLRYGNFVFAYRTLSRIKDQNAFDDELKDVVRDPATQLQRFRARKPKLLDIDRISRPTSGTCPQLRSRPNTIGANCCGRRSNASALRPIGIRIWRKSGRWPEPTSDLC